MATLTDTNIDAIHAELMREFSAVREVVPITKAQLRALIVLMDGELATAETSIVQATPAGAGKTWLVANAPLARTILIRTLEKRREVL